MWVEPVIHPTRQEWHELSSRVDNLASAIASVASGETITRAALATIINALARIERKENLMSNQITDVASSVAVLVPDVAQATTAMDSAVLAFQGLEARLAAALGKATALQATPEQLAALTALHNDLQAHSQALAEAVAAVPTDAPAASAPEQPVDAPPADAPADTDAPSPDAPAPATDETAPDVALTDEGAADATSVADAPADGSAPVDEAAAPADPNAPQDGSANV